MSAESKKRPDDNDLIRTEVARAVAEMGMRTETFYDDPDPYAMDPSRMTTNKVIARQIGMRATAPGYFETIHLPDYDAGDDIVVNPRATSRPRITDDRVLLYEQQEAFIKNLENNNDTSRGI